MIAQTEEKLSSAETNSLRDIVQIMIPCDAQQGRPGASDASIFANLTGAMGRDISLIRTALAEIDTRANCGFASLDQDRREALINEWYAAGSPAALALGRAVLSAYYRDDRVLRALGLEARAPFPQGHVVEPGDWSLLDPVKRRATFWRDDKADPSAASGRPDKGGPADGSGGA